MRDNPDINEGIASVTALGRAGLPDDVGGVVASLLSPEMRRVKFLTSWLPRHPFRSYLTGGLTWIYPTT